MEDKKLVLNLSSEFLVKVIRLALENRPRVSN